MVQVNRHVLQNALEHAGGFIAPRSPSKLLSCVKISADVSCGLIEATNNERSLRRSFPVLEKNKDWSAIVDFADVISAVRKIPDEDVRLEADDKLILRGNESKFEIPCIQGEFSQILDAGEELGEVPAGALKQAIGRTVYAAKPIKGSYILAGLLLTLKKGILVVEATDRTQCAHQECRLDRSDDQEIQFVLPAATAGQVRAAIEDPDEMISIRRDGTRIFFVKDRITIMSCTIDGAFPPVSKIFSYQPESTAIEAEALLVAAEQALAITKFSEISSGAKFNFTLDKLIVEAHADAHGEMRAEVPWRWNYKPRCIELDPKNVVNAVRASGFGEVQLGVAKDDSLMTLIRSDGFRWVTSRIVRAGL